MKYILIIFSILNLINIIKCDYTNLIWSDEFNGDSLNTNDWDYALGYLKYNNELQSYTNRNSYVKNGNLNIVAKKEDDSGARYTSTRIRLKRGFKYGRFEARVKAPKGNGLWPAVWLLPTNSEYGDWPTSGEMDIMEMRDDTDFNDATMHYGNAQKHDMGNCRTQMYNDFSTDFHTYAIEWEPSEIRWYIDNQLYCTKNSWWNDHAYPAPFNQEFSFIINDASRLCSSIWKR